MWSGSAVAVVALYAELDDDLRQEGLAREVLNRIQVARKEANLAYTGRIEVRIEGGEAVLDACRRFEGHLCQEGLITRLDLGQGGSEAEAVDGHPFRLSILSVQV